MRVFLRHLLLPFILVFFAAGALRAAELAVVIVSSERGAAYEEAAGVLMHEFERNGLARKEILLVTTDELGAAGRLAPKLFIALGTEAASVLSKSDTKVPVLCTLLPRISFDRVLQDSGRRSSSQFSALYLNQPLVRQLDLIRLALPEARRVGLMLGAESQTQAPVLEAVAQARGFKLINAQVEPGESIYKGLRKVLEQADLLLALPDPQIYNSSSIQNILLTSYRARVPLVAFSPAYVKAGALLAVYTTPTQLGVQAALMARSALQGKALPTPQYPQDFMVMVNEHVARSLGLGLESTSLTERLQRMERGS